MAFVAEVAGAWLVIAIVLSPLIPIALLVVVARACGTGEHDANTPPRPAAIDLPALERETLASGTKGARQIYCQLADEFPREQSRGGPGANDILARIQEEYAALCDSLSAAVKHAESAMSHMSAGSPTATAEVYAFSVFDGGTEVEAGPFSSLADCEVAESLARVHRVPTRVCGEWNPLLVDRE